jgi:carboxypeptidase C (cathepsin A)
MIFLDQPVNVGYSYGGASVSTSHVVGEDVYAFMQLFINRFPQYADLPFFVSGESYAGT